MCIVYHITVSLFVMEIHTLFVRSFADKFKPASLCLLYQASIISFESHWPRGPVDFKSYFKSYWPEKKLLTPNVRDQCTKVNHIARTKLIRTRL